VESNKRSFGFWSDEDLVSEAAFLAYDLGYNSLSEFINELLRIALEAKAVAEDMGVKKKLWRRFISSVVFTRIKTKVKLALAKAKLEREEKLRMKCLEMCGCYGKDED